MVNYTIIKSFKDAVNKTLDQRFWQDHCQPVIEFQNSIQNNIQDIISEKDWRPKEIGFFDPNCTEQGLIATINYHIYYQDVYAFINWLKNIILSWLIKKFLAILLYLLRKNALIWYATKLFANKKEMLKLVFLDYWYIKLIARFKKKMSNILYVLQVEKYIIADTQKKKSPYIYA